MTGPYYSLIKASTNLIIVHMECVWNTITKNYKWSEAEFGSIWDRLKRYKYKTAKRHTEVEINLM